MSKEKKADDLELDWKKTFITGGPQQVVKLEQKRMDGVFWQTNDVSEGEKPKQEEEEEKEITVTVGVCLF